MNPEVLAYFAQQQREQQHYVRTAQVQRNVRETRDATLALMDKYIARGLAMDEQEERSNAVLLQSRAFASEAQGMNRFYACWCFPLWWCERGGGGAANEAPKSGGAARRRPLPHAL
jgi:hypothetical protein